MYITDSRVQVGMYDTIKGSIAVCKHPQSERGLQIKLSFEIEQYQRPPPHCSINNTTNSSSLSSEDINNAEDNNNKNENQEKEKG